MFDWPLPERQRRIRGEYVIIAMAIVLVLGGFSLWIGGFDEYHAGNLIIFGGLLLMLGMVYHQVQLKTRF